MKESGPILYRRNLPYWRLKGSVYFVTWRLGRYQPPLIRDERNLVVDAIRHFEAKRYELHAYVVMDDHVHVLVRPLIEHPLKNIVHSWKSFIAKELRKLRDRKRPVWQGEYFDLIVRDEAELVEKAQYIFGNPSKRWPDTQEYPWVGYGSHYA